MGHPAGYRFAALESLELDLVFGLALLALTLYSSTLSYALRIHSRSRLADRLSEPTRRVWLDRLDRYDSQFQTISSLIRVVCVLTVAVYVYAQFQVGLANPTDRSFWLATLTIVLILALVVVAIPNAMARYAAEAVVAQSLGFLSICRIVLMPLEKAMTAVDFIVRRLLGVSEENADNESERIEQEILDAVSEGELHGAVDEEQKEIIESVFELHDTAVSAIMTPRTDIIAIPVDETPDRIRATIVEAGHSRVPVYERSLDQILGVLYAKDLLRLDLNETFDVRQLMRSVPYVPETKTINHLLRELRQQRVHIAIVLDEYGGTAGLVTIEDILEELVGEIDDEFDRSRPPAVQRINDDTLEVDARVHVHDVNEELGTNIPENGDYETIGGFVFTSLGKIPQTGEEITHENISISVLDAEPRKINRLRIRVERHAQPA